MRLIGLGSDILNSDGARWYRRSSNFLSALQNGNFSETYQHYQPGVSLMWIRSLLEYATTSLQSIFSLPQWYMDNYIFFEHIHTLSKTALVLVLFCLFVYQISIINKLFGTKVAVIFSILVAVEPYFAGIDRWFHLTSLEVYLSFSAFITTLYWAKQKYDFKILVLSGIFLALSVLSKVTGIITLLPIMFVIAFEYWQNKTNTSWKELTKQILILLFSFIATVFIFLPALWTSPEFVIQNIYKAINSAVNGSTTKTPLSVISDFSYYFIILIYKLSPVTIIMFLISLIYAVSKKKHLLTKNVLLILLYFLSYYLVLSIASKKIDRYSLSLFPPIILFISIFISKINLRAQKVVFFGAALVTVFVIINNFPVLSSFYSPVLGGEKNSIKYGYYDNSGEYFAQAAHYLNQQDSKKIFIPDNFETFKFFSKNEIAYDLNDADYVLLSHDTKRPQLVTTHCKNLMKTFGPRYEKPVVYLYSCDAAN